MCFSCALFGGANGIFSGLPAGCLEGTKPRITLFRTQVLIELTGVGVLRLRTWLPSLDRLELDLGGQQRALQPKEPHCLERPW